MLYLTVSKWRGEAVFDDFDRSNAGSQSGLDDVSYAADLRRFAEVVITFLFNLLHFAVWLTVFQFNYLSIFTMRAYARAVLGVIILSICLSVCLSHTWIVTKLNDALQIF